MNENEIITAWKCCSNVITSSCKECPLHLTYNANCVRELMRVSLDLYTRLKAENFNLKEEVKHFQLKNSELFKLNNSLVEENDYRKSENERLKAEADMADGYADALEAKAKSEAYREFAEKIKEGEVYMRVDFPNTECGTETYIVLSDDIDTTLKELTESNE
jgi:hypothetical protein